ncbi:MAG: Cysteine desulfurase [candidate division Hyd24-12 bacterium ADurb.Bin004]|nr:MAG: Cysteine desulfurase [candidate division Hyd24-12 bacterium ADurb.Bin004]
MNTSSFACFFPSIPETGAYLDSAAKTLTCRAALEAQSRFYAELDCNVERGIYTRSAKAEEEVRSAREAVAALVGVPAERLAFFPSTTAAINTVALGCPWREGQRVVTTNLEHHSNFLPWLALRRRGVVVDVLQSGPDGYLDPAAMSRAAEGAALVAFTHASNVTGAVQDLAGLSRAAAEAGAMVVVDGAQAMSHAPVDLAGLPVDAYAFSGHKCFGPTGTGAMYVSERMLAILSPPVLGGGSARHSSPEGFEPVDDPPLKSLEPGTANIAGILGFGAAAAFRAGLDQSRVEGWMDELIRSFLERLADLRRVTLFGPASASRRLPVFSIAVEGLSPHVLALRLDQEFGLMTRSGTHCAPTLWESLYGRSRGGTRISLHIYNGVEDVDLLARALARISGSV